MNALTKIQTQLRVKKSRYNKYGNFHYRSCEDILEASKPLLAETGATLTFDEDIILLNNRLFVKSTALLRCDDKEYSCSSFAGLAFDRISDSAQATGAATSYARKYALNGLLLIDDGEDNDSLSGPAAAATDNQTAPAAPAANVPPPPPPPPGGRK